MIRGISSSVSFLLVIIALANANLASITVKPRADSRSLGVISLSMQYSVYSSTTLFAITSIVDLSGNSTSITGNSLESSSGTNLLGELK